MEHLELNETVLDDINAHLISCLMASTNYFKLTELV